MRAMPGCRSIVLGGWVGVLPWVLAAASCTPTTGTRTTLTPVDLGNIRTVGVRVKCPHDFSVRIRREEMTNTGAIAGGMLGGAMESVIRSSYDGKIEDQLKPALGRYDPVKDMRERLCVHLQRSGRFGDVRRLADDKTERLDAVVEVSIKEWGFRVALGSGAGERVRAAVNIHARMILPASGKTLLERHELYLGSDGHAVYELHSREGLLAGVLADAVDNVSARIVNEIVFP